MDGKVRFIFDFWSNSAAKIGGILVFIIIFIGVFAPWVAPNDPYETNPIRAYESPSIEFPFGADEIGRCVFSRTVYGTRITMSIALFSLTIAFIIGAGLGILAGYFKKLDTVIMRFIDILMCFPAIIIAIAIVAILGPGLWNVAIAVSIGHIPAISRLVRGTVLSIREKDFVEASNALGASNLRIIFSHIAINGLSPVVVYMTVEVAWALLSISSLGFLGLGATPPTPEWGALVNAGKNYLRFAPHAAILPCLFIFITVLGFNLLGDGLRDVMDPRLKKV